MIFKDEIEAGEFVQALNDLEPHGGGDCPEYAFTGMLEALYQEPQWGSPMYVFTDAGPKDALDEFIEEVKHLASPEEYGVTINFFTTGKECNESWSTESRIIFSKKDEIFKVVYLGRREGLMLPRWTLGLREVII